MSTERKGQRQQQAVAQICLSTMYTFIWLNNNGNYSKYVLSTDDDEWSANEIEM